MTKEMFTARKNSFSRILAAAIAKRLPGAEIVQAGLSCHGFYCDFSASFSLPSELLICLEEEIRQVIREKQPILLLDMVPFSGAELLKSIGQRKRAAQLSECEGLMRIVRIGAFADWCEEEEFLPNTEGAGVFRLLAHDTLDRATQRVFGICASSKKELKELAVAWKEFEGRDHENWGHSRGLWASDGAHRLWLPQGIVLRDCWIRWWKQAFSPIAEEVEGGQLAPELLASKVPSSQELVACRAEFYEGERGLLDAPFPLALILNHFLDLGAFCISFLQIANQSLTLLGFAYRIRYSGKKRKGCPMRKALQQLDWEADEESGEGDPKLEFLVEDALRCEWVAVSLSEQSLKGKRSVFASVWIERNLALLIERSDGRLPFWLFPQESVNGSGRQD